MGGVSTLRRDDALPRGVRRGALPRLIPADHPPVHRRTPARRDRLGDRLDDFNALLRLRTSIGLERRVPQEWAKNVRLPTSSTRSAATPSPTPATSRPCTTTSPWPTRSCNGSGARRPDGTATSSSSAARSQSEHHAGDRFPSETELWCASATATTQWRWAPAPSWRSPLPRGAPTAARWMRPCQGQTRFREGRGSAPRTRSRRRG
jgi:hypothetical protein